MTRYKLALHKKGIFYLDSAYHLHYIYNILQTFGLATKLDLVTKILM